MRASRSSRQPLGRARVWKDVLAPSQPPQQMLPILYMVLPRPSQSALAGWSGILALRTISAQAVNDATRPVTPEDRVDGRRGFFRRPAAPPVLPPAALSSSPATPRAAGLPPATSRSGAINRFGRDWMPFTTPPPPQVPIASPNDGLPSLNHSNGPTRSWWEQSRPGIQKTEPDAPANVDAALSAPTDDLLSSASSITAQPNKPAQIPEMRRSLAAAQDQTPLSSSIPSPNASTQHLRKAGFIDGQPVTLQGVIKEVSYSNDSTGYRVISLKVNPATWSSIEHIVNARASHKRSHSVAVVGTSLSPFHKGQTVVIEGTWALSSKFGSQIVADRAAESRPQDDTSLVSFLAGSLARVGPKTAELLVQHFGEGIHDVLNQPDAAKVLARAKIRGVGPKSAEAIKKSWDSGQGMRTSLTFLQGVGVPPAAAQRLAKHYGTNAEVVMRKDPYTALLMHTSCSFRVAEHIAQQLAVSVQLPSRGAAALYQVVLRAATIDGKTHLTWSDVQKAALSLLDSSRPTSFTAWKEDIDSSGRGHVAPSWQDRELYASARLLMDLGKLVVEDEEPVGLGLDGGAVWGPDARCFAQQLYQAEVDVAEAVARRSRAASMTQRQGRLGPHGPLQPGGVSWPSSMQEATAWLADYELKSGNKAAGISFNSDQRKAVAMAADAPLMILTGAAGCGKTFTTQAIVQLWLAQGKAVRLCAPTGRAAQRLQEAVATHNTEASTIHRMLGVKSALKQQRLEATASSSRDSSREQEEVEMGLQGFLHNQDNPLDVDAVLVDEASMMDVQLAAALLRALPPHCQIMVVGDPNQLPPVQPGCVLQALLASREFFAHVHLGQIFRQSSGQAPTPLGAAGSSPTSYGGKIVSGAHQVMNGEYPGSMSVTTLKDMLNFLHAQPPSLHTAPSLGSTLLPRQLPAVKAAEAAARRARLQTVMQSDALIIEVPADVSTTDLTHHVIQLVRALPHAGIDIGHEVQVLSPMRKFADHFSRHLAEDMNPRLYKAKALLAAGQGNGPAPTGVSFKLYDRVVQVVNNYDQDVYNGDMGIITRMVDGSQEVDVQFPPRPGQSTPHTVTYSASNLVQLQSGWATTIHKAQGGEFPVVVLPLHHKLPPTLLTQALLYTGITRARDLLLLVSTKQAIEACLNKHSTDVAWATGLTEFKRRRPLAMQSSHLDIRIREALLDESS